MENGNTEEVGIEKINRIYDSTIEKEINDLFIKFADRYFNGREYNQSKMKDWGDALINGMETTLKQKKYKFYILLNIFPKKCTYGSLKNCWSVIKKVGSMELKKQYPSFKLNLKVLYFNITDKNLFENYDNIESDIKRIISNIIDIRKYVKPDIKKYMDDLKDDFVKHMRTFKKNFHYYITLSKAPYILLSSFKFINCLSNEYSFGINYNSTHINCTINAVMYDL